MALDELKIALILDEFFVRKQELTALTIAELAYPLDKGDSMCEPFSGVQYDVVGRGFRPKRGGLDGILRSELSREASIMIKGKANTSLLGRFLVPLGADLASWVLSVRIDHFLQDRIITPAVTTVMAVVVGTPIVVEVADRERGVGILVLSSVNGGLAGNLRVFARSGGFTPGEELALNLTSPALSSGPVFLCTVTNVGTEVEALANPVLWPAEL